MTLFPSTLCIHHSLSSLPFGLYAIWNNTLSFVLNYYHLINWLSLTFYLISVKASSKLDECFHIRSVCPSFFPPNSSAKVLRVREGFNWVSEGEQLLTPLIPKSFNHMQIVPELKNALSFTWPWLLLLLLTMDVLKYFMLLKKKKKFSMKHLISDTKGFWPKRLFNF